MATTRVNLNGSPVKPTTKPRPKPKGNQLHRDCTMYILGAIALSVALNGYAGWTHGGPIGALVMGLIPVGILKLSEIASKLGKRKADLLKAKVVASVGLTGLFLSLWHVSEAIAMLTGSAVWQAWALAITIDAGIVACEYVKTTSKD